MRSAVPLVFVLVATLTGVARAQPAGELLDRTLAIVGGRAVTLSDVRAATGLGLIEPTASLDAATERLVERTLVLREVERYAPPEPPDSTVDTRLEEIRSRVPEPQFAEAMAATGFTEARLRTWVRDDLRIAAYLEQRFAAAADLAGEQATPDARERLSAERRRTLIEEWIADLRRRTPVVELWRHQ